MEGREVTLSDTSDGYDGAMLTWENLLCNVSQNQHVLQNQGGHAVAIDLDWCKTKSRFTQPQFDLAIAADILYEPRLFSELLSTLKVVAPVAVLVQNMHRQGTQEFIRMCACDTDVTLHRAPFNDYSALKHRIGPDIAGNFDENRDFEVWTLIFKNS